MKSLIAIVAWVFVALVIVWASVNPESGLLYNNPGACLGVGLIGMGLCMEARKRRALG